MNIKIPKNVFPGPITEVEIINLWEPTPKKIENPHIRGFMFSAKSGFTIEIRVIDENKDGYIINVKSGDFIPLAVKKFEVRPQPWFYRLILRAFKAKLFICS